MLKSDIQTEIKHKLQDAIARKGVAFLSVIECKTVLGWLSNRGRPRKFANDKERWAYHNEQKKNAKRGNTKL